MKYWAQKQLGSNWYTLNSDPSIYFYIQPSGCFEVGEYDDDGTQSFAHFCTLTFPALQEALDFARSYDPYPQSS